MIPKRHMRVLSQDEIDRRKRRGLSLDPKDLRDQGMLLPIRGGSPEGDEEEDDDKSEEDEDESDDEDDDDAEAKKKSSSKKRRTKKEDEDEDEEDEDDDTVTMSKNEAARLRRIAKEKEAADKKAKKDKEDADRKRKEEAGEFEELLKEERDKTAAETKRADDAEEELKTFKFQVNVGKVAKDIGFKDPTDAFLYLDKEQHLESDERTLERALKKVLDKKDYLKAPRTATGGSGSGGSGSGNGSGPHFSFEEIRNMTTDQINEHWNEPGFQEALKNAGRSQ